MPKNGRSQETATVVWEGDSLEVLRDFPIGIRRSLGSEIRKLQDGDMPSDSRPMQSIGRGCFELRESDNAGWYRVVYVQRIEGVLYMLHSFVKKSAKTSKKDIEIARRRLGDLRERLAKEKKHGSNQ